MKKGINLALGRKRVSYAFKKLFYVTVGLFCVSVTVSLGLLAYQLFLKSSYDSLDQKEQLLNSQLLANQDKKDKLIETKTRLGDIRSVISKRSPINARLDTIYSVIPPASQIRGVTGSDEDLEFSLESEDLLSLNELIEQKLTDLAVDKKKGIQKVEMKSFGLNPKTLRYFITVGVTFI